MPVSVVCKCGKRLRAKDELAGKRVKCPACGEPLLLPDGLNSAPELAGDFSASGQSALAAAPSGSSDDQVYDVASPPPAAAVQGEKKCPWCLGALPADAVICSHCGFDLRTQAKRPSGRPARSRKRSGVRPGLRQALGVLAILAAIGALCATVYFLPRGLRRVEAMRYPLHYRVESVESAETIQEPGGATLQPFDGKKLVVAKVVFHNTGSQWADFSSDAMHVADQNGSRATAHLVGLGDAVGGVTKATGPSHREAMSVGLSWNVNNTGTEPGGEVAFRCKGRYDGKQASVHWELAPGKKCPARLVFVTPRLIHGPQFQMDGASDANE